MVDKVKEFAMRSDYLNLPLVVIGGPTASGKTSLAIKLAKKFNGEIICADSRSVYKGMDVGTAKPSKIEQLEVPHWGLDLVEPGEYFSAADFKNFALTKIDEIRSRGCIPFLVGGTGLYIDSIIFDYNFGDKADNNQREKLNKMTIEQLWNYCSSNNIIMPENKYNKRYIIRNIERNSRDLLRRDVPIDNSIVVAISTDRDVLRSRIALRIEQLFNDGVVNEAKMLGEMYGWEGEAFKSNAYPPIKQYLSGLITFDEMRTKMITLDWRLAKRQLTWLRRNKFIHWGSVDDLDLYLNDLLAKQS